MSNVINFGDFQITSRSTAYRPNACQHKHLTIDSHGGVISCDDCGKQIDPLWALEYLAMNWSKELAKTRAAQQEAKMIVSENIHTKAAMQLEKAWRKRSMVPACPHCHRGIFASDGLGNAMINAEMEKRRRTAEGKRP
ncbi:MAG: hypothetical protein LW865_15715 [Betaproteobacteria bacterium]|jgi:hypothetical protein|nr:hypothetical protein [Betaproteobacteria bacterium]